MYATSNSLLLYSMYTITPHLYNINNVSSFQIYKLLMKLIINNSM